MANFQSFKCTICQCSSFSSNEELQQHLYSFHRTTPCLEDNYICDKCKKHFTTRVSLNKHKIICKGATTRSFADAVASSTLADFQSFNCTICQHSSFSSNAELQQHIISFHRTTPCLDVNYICDRCEKHFMTLISLNKHKIICKGGTTRSFTDDTSTTASSSLAGCHGDTSHSQDDNFNASSLLDSMASSSAGSHGGTYSQGLCKDMEIGEDPAAEFLTPGHHDELQVLEYQLSTSESSVDADHDEEIELEIEDVLQQEVGSFLVNLKDNCYATQKILNEVIKGVDGILEIYLDWIKNRFHKKFSSKEYISFNEISDVLRLMKGLSIFQGAQDTVSFLEETGRLVKPVKVVFKTKNVINKDGSIEQEDEEFAYKVPFLPQLETFLNCEDVLKCVDNPRKAIPGTYKSLLDGSVYQQHPVVRLKDPKALAVVVHIDGAEVSDSASPRAGLNNLTNISWQLANVYPELASTDRTINLLATIKTRWLTHERTKVLLEDLTDAMKKLASVGVIFNIKDFKRKFHGLLLAGLGDHPAQGFIGGFKESVSKTLLTCRRCLAPNPDHLHECDISVFLLRTLTSHENHVKEVEEYVPAKGQAAKRAKGQPHPDPSVRYGVNYRSPLMSIPHFDVTKCLLQDVMHIGPEGLLEMVCRMLMHQVIIEKKKKLLTDVNDEISELSKCFRNDRPSSVNKPQHLTKKLRQSAAQMNNLAILLPFVLRKNSMFPCEAAAYLQLHIRLLRILNLCMAFDLKNEDAERLSTMISEFHTELLQIEPNLTMAKIHFIHHLPEQVYSFGIIRQQACYRFESHFAVLKRIARLLHNTKNLSMSIAFRHQTKQCQAMVQPGGFLYKGHEFGKRTKISSNVNEPSLNMLKTKISTPFEEIEDLSMIKVHGSVFQAGKSIILTDSSSLLPKFAKILQIFYINREHIGFYCQEIKTNFEDMELNAYNITLLSQKMAVCFEDLKFPHEILLLQVAGKSYAIPKGHRELLT